MYSKMEKGIFLYLLLYIIMHHKDGFKQNNVEPLGALCSKQNIDTSHSVRFVCAQIFFQDSWTRVTNRILAGNAR